MLPFCLKNRIILNDSILLYLVNIWNCFLFFVFMLAAPDRNIYTLDQLIPLFMFMTWYVFHLCHFSLALFGLIDYTVKNGKKTVFFFLFFLFFRTFLHHCLFNTNVLFPSLYSWVVLKLQSSISMKIPLGTAIGIRSTLWWSALHGTVCLPVGSFRVTERVQDSWGQLEEEEGFSTEFFSCRNVHLHGPLYNQRTIIGPSHVCIIK